MSSTKTLIVIVGPTAVGKTALAIELAKHFQTEIISADSRQFYRELELGTAKPDASDLVAVPHHLINSHSISEVVDAGEFERLALQILNGIFLKNDIAIAVGGSGLYVQALCEGLDAVDVRDDKLRDELSAMSLLQLQEMLCGLDPEYFEEVDQHNPQRLMRAIEVSKITGKKYSEIRTGAKKNRDFNCLKIGLNDDREVLYNRINQRVDAMVLAGLEDEARSLLPFKNSYALQTVGYSEWFDYFEGKITREQCIDLIKRNSRRYAKRQLTWFKRDKEIAWFDVGKLDELFKFVENRYAR